MPYKIILYTTDEINIPNNIYEGFKGNDKRYSMNPEDLSKTMHEDINHNIARAENRVETIGASVYKNTVGRSRFGGISFLYLKPNTWAYTFKEFSVSDVNGTP
jgi:hypothetical protein